MLKDSGVNVGDTNKSKLAFRPDLNQSTTPGYDAERILSSINTSDSAFDRNGRRSNRLPSRFALFILATVTALSAGYWFFASQTQASGSPKSSDIAKPAVAVATAKLESVSNDKMAGVVLATPSTTEVLAPEGEKAALIVNDPKTPNPAPDPVSSVLNAQDKLTDALEKNGKPLKAAIPKELEDAPKFGGQAGVVSAAKAGSGTTVANDPNEHSKELAKASQKADHKADPKGTGTSLDRSTTLTNAGGSKVDTAPASKSASITQSRSMLPAGDKDANLIAALLTHNALTQATSTSTRPPPPKLSAPETLDASIKTRSATSTASANKRVASAIAEPPEPALKKCEGLDFWQSEVCRFKACDRLWEIDASCRATLSSNR